MSGAVTSVVLLAGCGGSEPITAATQRLSAEDLRPLVVLAPEATGWEWSAEPETRSSSAAEIKNWDPTHAIQTTLRDEQLRAGLVASATTSWWDRGMKASSFATSFETPEGARSALAAGRTFAGAWYPEFEAVAIGDVEVEGLGEENWAVGSGSQTKAFVEIAWTRGNALLGVYVNCSPCASDVTQAARRWADAIDEAARAATE